MAGLRAKHKIDRNSRIVEAASGLFRREGYEGARIEEIAAKAEVSVGTIYNYYRNKGDILVAIVSMEVHEVLAAGQRILQKPPKNVEKAVDALIATYIDHSLVYLSKEMWRQAMATSTQQPDSPFGKTYTSLDRALADQTCALILKLQELDLARNDIDARGVGEMLFNNMNMMFIEFIKREDMSNRELRADIRRQNKTLIAAISAR
ncbi:MAG TPA: TetR/AcrR family transcriptional regulator [Aestuariivirga sp.]|nr:TetR/AcrR family transcriptional regulator [Aestuariivirga sp.]